MCKLDIIIKTTPRKIANVKGAKRGKSLEQIEYMTDILFAVAKRTEEPLDKTLEQIQERGLMTALNNAYRNRKKIKAKQLVEDLHKKISE